MTALLALAAIIPATVLLIEARPDSIDRWWCEHVHRNRDHTRTNHYGAH